MKKSPFLIGAASATLLIGVLVLLNFGCGQKNPGTSSNPNAGPKSSAAPGSSPVVSAEKTSFTEVTSQLDPGGNFYLYLGTAQWLDGLSAKLGGWREMATALPDLKPEDSANVTKAFDIVTRLVKDSGIEEVSGVGLSSVEIEKGMYRNKAVLHHYAGQGTGFLWQLAGPPPHALTGLDYLPSDTALAMFFDADVSVLWSVVQKETAQCGVPQAQQWLQEFPVQFEAKTKVKWDSLIHSLGGEFGFVVTLDPSNNIPVPLPGGATVIPTPGFLFAVKVNDDTLFNQIDEQLKGKDGLVSVNNSELKMRTVPVPVPLVGELRPSAASTGGYLFVATTDTLINRALAVKDGKEPGLTASDEFKHLAQGIPAEGNHFIYLSQRFAGTLMQIQKQALSANLQSQPQMAQWMQSFYASQPAFAYSVGMNTPEGCVTVANSSQSYANTALIPALVVPGMLAAIAIPNFVKARTTAQENTCINNLRQLDAAKNEWALEKHKTAGDVPTREDLLPYVNKWPVCPAGGHYTIGPVGESPKCSIPGHVLP